MPLTASLKALRLGLICALNTSCILFTADKLPSPDTCETTTRHMVLSVEKMKAQECANPAACLVAAAAISTGSLIVMGSLVLVNNTVHWAELQGNCKHLKTIEYPPKGCVQECDLATQQCQCLI